MRLIRLFFSLILFSNVALADGPFYNQADPITEQEFREVYQALNEETDILTEGTSGYVMTSQGNGVRPIWSVSPSAILQVVEGTSTSSFSTSSTSMQDTNLSASITPASASNKVLVIACGGLRGGNPSNSTAITSLARGSTEIGSNDGIGRFSGQSTSTEDTTWCGLKLDSPSTTSATTYKVRMRSDTGSTSVTFGVTGIQIMILMEVAG